MKLARLAVLLLAVCLMTGAGCGRKKNSAKGTQPTFSPEAMQQITEAEKTPQASLVLLNETLKDWVLLRNQLPRDLNEFVTARMLPRLPAAPPGKRFVVDAQQRRVVLADQ